MLLFFAACVSALPDLDDAHRDLTAALPVFPGAEGFGTDTPAGRGGQILVVSTLDEAGPGSLAEALQTPGPRTIVFEVGGVLPLAEHLRVTEPFVTIAGQTAPAPGLTLTGGGLLIETHDVLVQHLSIRPGDGDLGPNPQNRDGISVFARKDGTGDVFGVVVDHCSFSWAVDENGNTDFPGVHDITFSNSLFVEGLWNSIHDEQPHAKGLLVGTHSRRVAVLRNVFAHNHDRNPVLTADTSSLVANNLVYDPGEFAIVMYNGRGWGPSLATIENNLVLDGPSTREGTPAVHLTSKVDSDGRVFVAQSGDVDDARGIVVDERPVTLSPLTLLPVEALEAALLADAGARPWDRDPHDARVLQGVATRTGGAIDSPADVGGLDRPRTTHVLELPDDPSGDADGDGYTDLEEWLHGFRAATSSAVVDAP